MAGKVLVLAAVAYVVMPLDALPDIAPVVGWLDDMGVALIALLYLSRALAPYRADRSQSPSNTVPEPVVSVSD